MAKLTGPGPVFAIEWLMASRRWQAYAMRSLTVLLLLVAMVPIWYAWPAATIAQQVQMGKVFYQWTAMILLGLVGLAATAGAICQDKARGSLALLFATDLSDAEIVLGKFAARLVPVLGMILCVALGLGLAASAPLIGAATWRIRAVVVRQLGRGEPAPRRRTRAAWSLWRIDLDRLGRWAPGTDRLCRLVRRAWPRPSLDRNPVLWRECQRKRPSHWDLVL